MIVNGYAFSRCPEGFRVLLSFLLPPKSSKPAWTTLRSKSSGAISRKTVLCWRTEMPKYYEFKIAGYYLYFTSYCVIECMHVHASDRRLTEAGSAKFFVRDNGDTVLQERGILTDREISKIQKFIKQNYQEMYLKWSAYSEQGFYNKK